MAFFNDGVTFNTVLAQTPVFLFFFFRQRCLDDL
jgi:hypothetical protein